jgi:hypothetical protein
LGSGGGGLCATCVCVTLGRAVVGEGSGFLLTAGLVVLLNEPDDVSEGLDDVAALLGPGAGVPANVPYFINCAVTRVSE